MGDLESRMEDARMDAAIDRAIARGDMGECYWCGVPTPYVYTEDEEIYQWMCKSCYKGGEGETGTLQFVNGRPSGV